MKFFIILNCFILLSASISHSSQNVCPKGQYQVRPHTRNGYIRSDGTFVKPTTVKAHCKVLSREYDYAVDRFKSGSPPNWPHKTEKVGKWIDSEKAQLIDSLEDIPDILLSPKIAGIYRLKKSKDYPNPASNSDDGLLVLYDSAFHSSRNLARILSHELAHQNYNELSEPEKQDYRRATGWGFKFEDDRTYYLAGRKTGYVEEDGNISPDEDYANNVEYFLYNPDKLKQVTPAAFKWLQKHFVSKLKLRRTQPLSDLKKDKL